MTLSWIKCVGDKWCPLNTVNLDHPHFSNMEGVYIIWHGGQNPATVRVGQGFIRDRLRAHRSDPEVQAYSALGLFVTWAEVAAGDRDGVEAYLASILQPLAGERFPQRTPIPVKLPW
jgi:hypothetical protein